MSQKKTGKNSTNRRKSRPYLQRPPKEERYFKQWQRLAIVALIISVATFAISELFHFPEPIQEKLHFIEATAFAVLVFDITYQFLIADDKKKFLRQNWLMILTYLPLGAFGRFARFSRVGQAIEKSRHLTHLTTHATHALKNIPKVSQEAKNIANIEVLGQGLNVKDIGKHAYRMGKKMARKK